MFTSATDGHPDPPPLSQPEADQKSSSSNSVSNYLRSLLPELPQKAPSIIDSTAPNVVKTF
jgi:hypothetical protein